MYTKNVIVKQRTSQTATDTGNQEVVTPKDNDYLLKL